MGWDFQVLDFGPKIFWVPGSVGRGFAKLLKWGYIGI